MTITLTDDQKKLQGAVRGFYTNKDSFLTVDGSAGTGKTTVLRYIYESEQNLNNTFRTIDPSYTDKHMTLTATTNKAVNVLQSQFSNTFVNVRTIHSLFGLRPFKGKLTCSYTPKDLAQSLKDRIIIIDECSMINDELYQIIKDVAAYGVKFIFVGDSNQLPPVKSKSISPVFSNPTVKLTEVVRQTDELLLLADSFRKFVELDEFPNIQTNGTSIMHLPQDEFEQMILDDMGTPGWTIRDSRVVAYTNKQVKHYNSLIKEDLTGTAAIVEGELVINNSYVKGNPNIAVPTEAEVYIRKITPHKTLVDGFRYVIVHGMKETALWMPKGPEEAKELQRVIKGMDSTPNYIYNVLADLRPMYASTIHKAQGSTFKRIYIDLNSIKSVQYYDPLMFKRLLYVAVSRASECVVFTGDI